MAKTVEEVKLESNYLRGTIAETLRDENATGFSADDKNLTKFHGFYQQKVRDQSAAPAERLGDTFMLRGRVPGGRLTPQQYLEWDALADRYSFGGLRITTRQTFQLHGVLKHELQPLIQAIYNMNLSTIAACGDVVRTVTQGLNPAGCPELQQLDAVSALLSQHFEPRGGAWNEIWINGKNALPNMEEPIYGKVYLPRKFKISVVKAGLNTTDLLSNDLGLAATFTAGKIDGYFVFAGGGMGMNHNRPETYPRLADLLGWVPAEQLLAAAEAVVTLFRDSGDRENRKHARLKYVVAEWGVDKFRAEVEARQGFAFDHRALPPWENPSYMGWTAQQNGKRALGLHILSGRIKDTERGQIKTALQQIVAQFNAGVQLTVDQDLILLDIAPADVPAVESILDQSGFPWRTPHAIFERALACVALPTCGLALAESERVAEGVLQEMAAALDARGLGAAAPIVRMTGCPNGCARPYNAEIGLVGQLPGKYAIYLGANRAGSSVSRIWKQKVPLADLVSELLPLFDAWQASFAQFPYFGDYVQHHAAEIFV